MTVAIASAAMAVFDQNDLEALGLAFGVPLAMVAMFVGLIYRAVHRPELPPVMAADGVVRLFGQLTPASTLLSFSSDTMGMVEATPYELIWRSQVGPEWRVPIPALLLRPPGVFGRNPGIVFEVPGGGRWRLMVSDGPVGPLMTDGEQRRRHQRAEELRYVLVSRGARMAA